MQGFILKITKVRNEDLIVRVLSESKILTLYRFYGARHSTINLGYKIDFETETDIGYLPKLRHITHLGFDWLKRMEAQLYWQQFIKELDRHLYDVEEIEPFYFDLCNRLCKKLSKQAPKRALLEGYLELLEYEGRLHKESRCFVCEESIQNDPVLVRGFLQAHEHCIPKRSFDRKKLLYFFNQKDSQFWEENEIEALWSLLMEGF